jgi:hypothetical protein
MKLLSCLASFTQKILKDEIVVIVHECNNKLITTSSLLLSILYFFVAYTFSMNQYHSVKTIGLLLLVLLSFHAVVI